MHLITDIGNTLIKTAIFHENEPVSHEEFTSYDDFRNYYEKNVQHKTIVSSVANIPEELLILLKKNNALFFFSAIKIPIKNRYKTPETLGYDRLANAIGAWSKNPGKNNLIIDCGTCLKFDFLNEKNEYLGGSISPGLIMRARALQHYTDRLPLVEPLPEPALIGDSTTSSILSGVCNGMTGEINAMIERYEKEYGEMMIHLTGGDSSFFAETLKNTIFADRFLTLRGLNEVLKFNA
ncbi:MAG: type III pantothenate kinase [Bacteroidota bacterium]